jgi:hypothetical protein
VLTVKGTETQAREAAFARGISLLLVAPYRRCEEFYCECLARDVYQKDIHNWYVSQNHRQDYPPGALLWHRCSILQSEMDRGNLL